MYPYYNPQIISLNRYLNVLEQVLTKLKYPCSVDRFMENKKHIVAVTAFIKNKAADKFLVVKRHAGEVAYPGKWAFPGGKVEKGQTLMEALRREVQEEVGLEIEDSKRLIKDFTFVRPDGHNVVGLCFSVIAKPGDVVISKDFDDFRWITPEELSSLDHIEGMEEEVSRAFK
jgi:8-oxo-dGTP diphosphatase